jgi:hypothetical protein
MASEDGLPRYEVCWEDTFRDSLARIGTPWRIFENLARPGIDTFLARDPYEEDSTHPFTGTDYRALWTERDFGDIPAMLIAYRVDDIARKVFIVGAEPVSAGDDFPDFS